MLRELTCRPFDVDHLVICSLKYNLIPLMLLGFREYCRGILDILLMELLSFIFTHLDFQSLGAL
jgi:hypothetical protein